MRQPTLLARTRLLAAAGLAISIVLAVPVLAHGVASGAATMPMTVKDRHLRYGEALRVSGRPGRAAAGRGLELQFRARGVRAWRTVARTTVAPDGTYAVRARVRVNGAVRVVGRAAGAAAAASSAQAVAVAATVRTTARRFDVLAGRTASLRGRLAPGAAGRRVRLEGRVRGRWITWDTAATDADGAYRLAFRPQRIGAFPARVRFGGDDRNAAATGAAGRLDVFRRAPATWYGPGLYGNRLACGGRLTTSTIGVAHKTLPCGTRITLRHRGRELRVKVIDRGPFSPTRDFDLTSATKRRLHFGDVGNVLATR